MLIHARCDVDRRCASKRLLQKKTCTVTQGRERGANRGLRSDHKTSEGHMTLPLTRTLERGGPISCPHRQNSVSDSLSDSAFLPDADQANQSATLWLKRLRKARLQCHARPQSWTDTFHMVIELKYRAAGNKHEFSGIVCTVGMHAWPRLHF